MTRFLFILLLSLICVSTRQDKYPYKSGKPTTAGIEQYVMENSEKFVYEFQRFVHDTIYSDIYFETDNLSEYYGGDSTELGYFYIPNSVVVTNQPLFYDYELSFMSKYHRRSVVESNAFVKATMMHQIAHVYFYQTLQELRYEKRKVALEFRNNTLNVYPNSNYNAEFIEEGVCEYISNRMGEIINSNKYAPKNVKELLESRNTYLVKYNYSRNYVAPFLDHYLERNDLKSGIKILLTNRPPTNEEIVHPELYFARLNI
jgi:hypothetical protein